MGVDTTSSTSSFSTVFRVKDPKDAADYTRFAGILEGELPNKKKDKYEIKQLDQADRAKRFRGSFVDNGTLTLKFQYTKDKLAKLYGYVDDPDTYPCQIELEDGAVYNFDALFEEVGTPLPADGGEIQSDVTIQVSGVFQMA